MTIKIHGKEYRQVSERVNDIHSDHKDKPLSIETEMISWEDSRVIFKCVVTTAQGVFNGHAYESEGSSQINKTSALENCETSAIGRALASAGYAGTEFASANEVQNAIHQQSETKILSDRMRFDARLKTAEALFEKEGKHDIFCNYLELTYGTNNIEQLAKERYKGADAIIEALTELYKRGQ